MEIKTLDEALEMTQWLAKDAGDLGAAACMLRNAARAEEGTSLTYDEVMALLFALAALRRIGVSHLRPRAARATEADHA
jgi:hypothetical protein